MGMNDGRQERPKKQWHLLYAFAERDGQLDWGHPAASRRNQKQKELLAKSLIKAFGIKEHPIVNEGSGWRTRFKLRRA
jgi:hypothetical protein